MNIVQVYGLVAIGLVILVIWVLFIMPAYGATEEECVGAKTDTLVIVDGNEVRDCNEWVEKFSNLGFKVTDYALAENRVAKIVMQR